MSAVIAAAQNVTVVKNITLKCSISCLGVIVHMSLSKLNKSSLDKRRRRTTDIGFTTSILTSAFRHFGVNKGACMFPYLFSKSSMRGKDMCTGNWFNRNFQN